MLKVSFATIELSFAHLLREYRSGCLRPGSKWDRIARAVSREGQHPAPVSEQGHPKRGYMRYEWGLLAGTGYRREEDTNTERRRGWVGWCCSVKWTRASRVGCVGLRAQAGRRRRGAEQPLERARQYGRSRHKTIEPKPSTCNLKHYKVQQTMTYRPYFARSFVSLPVTSGRSLLFLVVLDLHVLQRVHCNLDQVWPVWQL